ncbi:MAG: hypothetical protein IJV42_01765 [Bacteroidaceae bacterium]|nr:hypothetical protein [Bacteroidaceae bacterium]
MKIIHSQSGLAYHLNPGTQLEVERTNLFFNDYGEHSLPVELPDTDRNRELTGWPHRLAVSSKPKADIPCVIEDGAFVLSGSQAVLGARRKEKITTTICFNEGEFLSRIKDVQLSDIYAGQVVPGVATVSQGIAFCQSLLTNQDPDFAIFPFLVDFGDQRRLINRLEMMDAQGSISATGTIGFYNAFERTQQDTEDADMVILPPGYYITPFIRVSSVLRRVFSYFGYTLQDSFLTTQQPFSSMVFVNNTIDSLLNGDILLTHLLPDCMVSTLLDVFRKKFCLEFVPDEVHKTVSVVRFTDMLGSVPSADLSPYLVGWPEVSFQEERQLRLSSENVVSEATAFEGVYLMAARHPEAWYNADDGCYYHMGYSTYAVREKLADGTLPYYAGGTRQVFDVTVPDCQYCFSSYAQQGKSQGVPQTRTRSYGYGSSFGLYPYIGTGRALNSTIIPVAPSSDDEDVDTVSDEASLMPILSFVWHDGNVPCGTNHTDGGWQYSLLYNGPYGIFERFWRDFDNCLRNALHKVRASLLLPAEMKASLPAHQRIVLRGEALFINVMHYAIGQRREPLETEFLTATLRRDASGNISTAPPESSRMLPTSSYTWKVVVAQTEITQQEYIDLGYEFDYDQWVEEGSPRINHGLPAIYPPPPTAEQYASGDTFYPRVTYRVTGSRSGIKFYRLDVSLRPVLLDEGESSLIWPPRQHELI